MQNCRKKARSSYCENLTVLSPSAEGPLPARDPEERPRGQHPVQCVFQKALPRCP